MTFVATAPAKLVMLGEYASANRTRVVRGNGEERTELRVKLGDVFDGSRGAENPELRDGDIVIVPESFF